MSSDSTVSDSGVVTSGVSDVDSEHTSSSSSSSSSQQPQFAPPSPPRPLPHQEGLEVSMDMQYFADDEEEDDDL
ncbi:hypothetical protein R3I93_022912 [Phoxinus phoxinus]|uniref:Uncharacterized protein n=1 Tax=Phoxinus phoxinus TaxID=58324 RepID=A0AAN9C590_9TELE